jgi:diguanylate cyclase (GGDEF)-like protein
MRADSASNMSCVNCHNAIEKSSDTLARRVAAGIEHGKQWKQHQLLGAIEANVPVDKVETIANEQARLILALGVITSLSGFGFAGWLALRDVRRERNAAAYFREQAKFDPLTRLGNRTLFNERGRVALANAKRSGVQIGIMFIDLDHFKQVNDRFGHQVGDRVLYEVGERFVACLRDTDLITRQGGDEFLVLLEGGQHRQNFESVAQKLLDALDMPFNAGQEKVRVGASIGISCAPEHGTTLDSLIEKADLAMYRAKRLGRSAFLMWREEMSGPSA